MIPIEKVSWYHQTVPEVLKAQGSHESGLTQAEAAKRLTTYGPNRLPEGKSDSLITIFLRQFQSPLIYILFLAAFIIYLTGALSDSLIIFGVLFFNALVGTIQEGRAQNTLQALKRFAETKAIVQRDNKENIIDDSEVVPGDIIVLQEGEKVPADARIIFANTLKIDEASLTGESEPVTKVRDIEKKEKLSVSDQKNMVFKGTNILSGNGAAIVVATGVNTEIGQIATNIAKIDTDIPLKKNIRYLSRLIIGVVALISIALIVLGILTGKGLQEMFLTAVALSVSIIPEGLPIVITLVLATGVHRMSKRNVLVKKLQAVEALGQTKIIAVDKTGTLTKNEMVIEEVYVAGKHFKVSGNGYEPVGEFFLKDKTIDPLNHPELLESGRIAGFCAGARVSLTQTGVWRVSGDPTEAAMLTLSEKMGFRKETLETEAPKIFEIPFDYTRKYHTTLHNFEGKEYLTVVGAPEKILALSESIYLGDKHEKLTADKREHLEKVLEEMAASGYRVVAYATNTNMQEKFDLIKMEENKEMPSLTFFGFFGMNDPLRIEVIESVKAVRAAGMKVVMITGDHKLTALSIAKKALIYQPGDEIIESGELERLSDGALLEKLPRVSVFARVTPNHKLRIIELFRKQGQTVAMTGDGVNDAPSLVAADLGVAMGKIGTEVAKEASDIVLLDDNFGSIVKAAEEGRAIYKTIKKVILYLFSTSLGEVLAIMLSIALGYPLPLLAAQIIWLNFVTDGFLDIALGMEPKESGLLNGDFEKPKPWIVDRLMLSRMIFMSLPMALGTMYMFVKYLDDPVKAGTVALTTLAVFQWFNVWNCRSETKSIFGLNPLRNKYLILATIVVISLQFLALHTAPLQKILSTVPISMSEWLLILPMASSIVVIEELRKLFYRYQSTP